ncbi:RTA1 like protein [Phlyctema vagabunda]|uniref:RTA1 like protein n=1 Tax=Phlyctema vagabunda TaxID=108571 RepID=A0ABR4P899_9HELO
MSDLAGLLPSPHGDAALLANPEDLCSLSTCDLTLAQLRYVPSLGGNIFFVAVFSCIFVLQAFLGVRYRTWSFLSTMLIGLCLNCIGYGARIMMHENPFRRDYYLLYLIPLTIAPVFISAALYICAARILKLFGDAEESRFLPRTYLVLFGTGSFVALTIKVIGGIVAATGSTTDTGLDVMQAGVFIQLFTLLIFTVACFDFGLPILRSRSALPGFTSEPHFHLFMVSMVVSLVAMLVQTIYQAVKFSISTKSMSEVPALLLEGSMPLVACMALTAFHPGRCLRGEPALKTFKAVDGKRVSASSFGTVVSMDVEQAPKYFENEDSTSLHSTDTRTAVVAMVGRPRPVHIEMSPIYGVPYECTRDDLPRPST